MPMARPVAIVTGGGRGIGSGISEALAAEGFDLLISYNTNAEAAQAFATRMKQANEEVQVAVVGGDIALPATRARVFEALDEAFEGRDLGAMVHNAGQYVGVTSSNGSELAATQAQFGNGSLLGEDGSPDLRHVKYYQAMYGDAFIDLCERALQRMGSGGGALVGVSSPGVSGHHRVNAGYSLPGSGKCVMEFAMRVIAANAGAKNVNCNLIVPGATVADTEEGWDKVADSRGISKDEIFERFSKVIPMKRCGRAREVGDMVAYLCGPKGRYVTGVILPVDGGLHLAPN